MKKVIEDGELVAVITTAAELEEKGFALSMDECGCGHLRFRAEKDGLELVQNCTNYREWFVYRKEG